MNRLLQGEVGSGKTVIALRAMLAAVDAGGQAALLAPTEVLAAQHHRSITAMLGDLAEGGMLGGSDIGTRVALLTGSQSAAAPQEVAARRRQRRRRHRHRHARADPGARRSSTTSRWWSSTSSTGSGSSSEMPCGRRRTQPPHVLVMTATPIPRTVAMTVFGDMETSTLTELPRVARPSRPTSSRRQPAAGCERTWERIAEEVRPGRQAYVVCPRIGDDRGLPAAGISRRGGPGATRREITDDGDDGDARRTRRMAESRTPRRRASLGERPRGRGASCGPTLRCSGITVDVLHGRMAPEDKDAAMARFTAGRDRRPRLDHRHRGRRRRAPTPR